MNLFQQLLAYIITKRKPRTTSNYIGLPSVASKVNIVINDSYGLKAQHQVNNIDIINLSGGFPTNDFIYAEFEANAISDQIMKVEYRIHLDNDLSGNPRFAAIDRTIDFEYKIIHNDIMVVQKNGKGIATNLFLNQVNKGRELGFNLIVVVAAGPGMDPPTFPPFRWDGYKTWAKYGYLMEQEFQTKFEVWAKRRRIKEKSLYKLHFNKNEKSRWEIEGFFWKGHFVLMNKSKSMPLLQKYLYSKTINVRLSQTPSSR